MFQFELYRVLIIQLGVLLGLYKLNVHKWWWSPFNSVFGLLHQLLTKNRALKLLSTPLCSPVSL